MNRTMRNVIGLAVVVLVAFLLLRACGSLGDQIMQGDQEALNKAIQVAASKGADYDQTSVEQRDYYNDVSKAESVTVMVYMCGADLESEDGAATADLNEMLHAKLGDDIDVIVETGGCTEWQNSTMDASTNQLWRLDNGGIEHLADLGLEDMTKPATLAEFLSYCKGNYPSDRNILVLWDHGGGSVGGYAYDENFPNSDAMAIEDIGATIRDSGIRFDMVGFDACLMASLEDALVLEPSADYMVASEIPEPGQGWYYTNWLTDLSEDPAIPTSDLSKVIVDDFIRYSHESGYAEAQTLSVVDLTKLPAVFDALDTFSSGAIKQLADGDFSTLSKAREDCIGRSSTQDYGMVDLAVLADEMSNGNDGSAGLIDAIDSCVIYNKMSNVGDDMHGLSIAFPYSDLSDYPALTQVYSGIGFNKSYAGFLSGFESIRSSGQTTGTLDGQTVDITSLPWYQQWLSDQYSSNGSYDTDTTLGQDLTLTEKNGGYVLHLSDEQWSQVTDIQLSVFYAQGGGYVDLGTDELYSFDDDGDLVVDYDGTWVALNGTIVEFYGETNIENDDGTWISTGYVPALVNGKEAQIVLQWDQDHTGGFVTGYRTVYDSGVEQKGVTTFKDGDSIEYMFDTYDDAGEYQGTYTQQGTVTYDGALTVSYEQIGSGEALVAYQLTDIYGNQYLTEELSYS